MCMSKYADWKRGMRHQEDWSKQQQGEKLYSFMARLRELICYAFVKEEAATVRSRVL